MYTFYFISAFFFRGKCNDLQTSCIKKTLDTIITDYIHINTYEKTENICIIVYLFNKGRNKLKMEEIYNLFSNIL